MNRKTSHSNIPVRCYLKFVPFYRLRVHMLEDWNLLRDPFNLWVEPAVGFTVKHLYIHRLGTVVGLYLVLILGRRLCSQHRQYAYEQQLAYSFAPSSLVTGSLHAFFITRLISFPTLSPFIT